MIQHGKYDREFLIVPNRLVRDPRLKLKDVGLLCYMLSLPQDWEFSLRGMDSILPQDGLSAINDSLKRLRTLGYVSMVKNRSPAGSISEWQWVVRDTPCIDFPDLDNQDLENRIQTKNLINKEKKNKETDLDSVFFPSGESVPDAGQKSELRKTPVPETYYIGEDGLVNW